MCAIRRAASAPCSACTTNRASRWSPCGPPFVYGPENPFYREAFFWDRLRADRPIIIPGDGNRLMQFVYVNDLVEACFNALEKHTAPGQGIQRGG